MTPIKLKYPVKHVRFTILIIIRKYVRFMMLKGFIFKDQHSLYSKNLKA